MSLRFLIQVEFYPETWYFLLPTAGNNSLQIPSKLMLSDVSDQISMAHIWTQRGKLTAHHRVLNFLCKCGYRVRSVAVRGNVIDHLQTRQYQPA